MAADQVEARGVDGVGKRGRIGLHRPHQVLDAGLGGAPV